MKTALITLFCLSLALAARDGCLDRGDRLAMLGIGSGLNCMMLGVDW